MKFDLRKSGAYFHALRVMGPASAVDVEMKCGMLRFAKLMRVETEFFPDASTWRAAVNWSTPKQKYPARDRKPYVSKIGLLLFCVKRKVPCPDFAALVQFCMDHEHVQELLVLRRHPVNEHGNKLRFGDMPVPYLDRALLTGNCRMFALCELLFGKVHVQRPEAVLEKLFLHWEFGTEGILRMLMPFLINDKRKHSIRSVRTLRIAAHDAQAIDFALQHCSKNAIGDELLLELCARGNVKAINIILHKFRGQGVQFTQQMWNTAFFHGHTAILEIDSRFKVTDELLVQVCRGGFLQRVLTLPQTTVFPQQCFVSSIASGNVELIAHMRTKFPQLRITKHMLMTAIESTDEAIHQEQSPFLLVFQMSRDVSLLDVGLKCAIVDRGLKRTMLALHKIDCAKQLGIDIINMHTLARAAATKNIAMLEAMMCVQFTPEAIAFAQEASFHPVESFDRYITRNSREGHRAILECQQVQRTLAAMQKQLK